MGLLVILLYLQEHMRPFDNPQASDNAKVQNNKLHRIESFSLLVLITMVWCAVFFVLGCDDQGGFCSVLGVSVILINIVFVGVVGVIFAQAWGKQNKLSDMFSALANSLRKGSNTNTEQHTVNSTLFPTDGETKIKCTEGNPLSNGKSKEEFKNERRRNSVTTREVEMTVTSIVDISNENIEILKDDGGREYSWNKVTNETKWVDEEMDDE